MALLTVARDDEALARLAAEVLVARVTEALAARGPWVMVALTGGSTPRRLYELLAMAPWRARMPWDRLHLFWGDERHVAPDHPDSNYGMARDALLYAVPIAADRVHRIRGELDAEEAARMYEREMAETFRAAGRDDVAMDVTLLGLGEDAHVASLFPQHPALDERTRRVIAPWVPHLDAFRVTLTLRALLESHRILMLVSGPKKAQALWAAVEAPEDRRQWPAQGLREAGDRVEWLVDRDAVRSLETPPG